MNYCFRQSFFYPQRARSNSPGDYDSDFKKLKSKSRKYERVYQKSKLKTIEYHDDNYRLDYMYDVEYDISQYFEL